MIRLKGIPASPGIAIGKTLLFGSEEPIIKKLSIKETEIPQEIAKFEDALIQTRQEILKIQKSMSEEMGAEHADIFNAHLLVLEDRTLIEEVITSIKKMKVNVEYAFREVLKKYSKAFSMMEDEYLKERVSDVEDVGRRVIRNLIGEKSGVLTNLSERVIVVAHDISPSDTALMHKQNVMGFVTDIGGKTSHTAIMAKSLEIPAVVGLEDITKRINNGDLIVVDGNAGEVVIGPDEATINRYESERAQFKTIEDKLLALKSLPAITIDGCKVKLQANIELPQEIPSVIAHGCEGIGLYRTEFFYMNRTDLPTEDEHYQEYKFVAEKVHPDSVIIRTLDLGGDKFLSHLDVPKEMNPFLGWRAIRFCLARPDIFKTQLRAILRASSPLRNLKIMYPMISGIEELTAANRVLEETKEELRQKGTAFDENIEVGAMIEIPSAALTCDLLAKEANFFSIGTNDLIQYALAVDRGNEKIAYLYEPAHPAVLRLLKQIIEKGHEAGIWVGMCGEMAGEPSYSFILLGLGLDEFSTSPLMVPEVKRVIRSVELSYAKEIARKALELSTGKEVDSFVKAELKKIVPELVER